MGERRPFVQRTNAALRTPGHGRPGRGFLIPKRRAMDGRYEKEYAATDFTGPDIRNEF